MKNFKHLLFFAAIMAVASITFVACGSKEISRAEQAVRELEAAKSMDEVDAIEHKYDDLTEEDFTESQIARVRKVYESFYYGEGSPEPEVEAVTVATEPVVDGCMYDTWDSTAYEAVEAYPYEYVDGYDYSARAEAAVRAIEAATTLDELVAIEQEYPDLSMDDFTPEQQARIMKAAQKFGL